jgi:uncharacterized protein YndB with AHSA1/START domain
MTTGPRGQVVPPAIVIERSYRASIAELWALWTTKDGFESWWAPDGYHAVVHVIEPRLGGALDYDMIADAPEMSAANEECGPTPLTSHARFDEFERLSRLTLVQSMDVIVGTSPYDHRIEVDFRARGDMASMIVAIQPHLDANRTRITVRSFHEQFDKLDRRLSRVDTI